MEATQPLNFFDCNCVIGGRPVIHAGSFTGADELVRKMGHYGISGAMVHHSLAGGYSPVEGNRVLMDEIAPFEQLKPVWVVMPHHTGEFPHPSVLMDELKANGVRLVKYLPDERNFAEWYAGPLFSMLEKYNVPILIAWPQFSNNWDILHGLLAAHPDLRVILTNLHYNCGRYLYPLLTLFPHLYIETIGFKIFGGIEEVCGRFGAGRLVFGSCAPVYSGGSAAGMIRYARISEDEKRAVAGGNLTRLLEGAAL